MKRINVKLMLVLEKRSLKVMVRLEAILRNVSVTH